MLKDYSHFKQKTEDFNYTIIFNFREIDHVPLAELRLSRFYSKMKDSLCHANNTL